MCTCQFQRKPAHRFYLSVFFYLMVLPLIVSAATQSKKVPTVAKWGRYEQSFKSSVNYSNALQDATLTGVFISPLGETNRVYGFWDGGKVWRVRFSPDQPGRWIFTTSCSDTANKGLHNHSGEFLCTAAAGQTRFNQHGPVRVARDRRHFEHADTTPFFWMADTVWTGPLVSDPKDWEWYARARASQKFNVAQWAVVPGADLKKQPAFTGLDHIAVNPEYFKRLDAKLETLSRAGILSAIAPLSEPGEPDATSALPDDQAALLVRYAVARWGANPVAWFIAVGDDNQPKQIARWKRIGHSVFTSPHLPVILYPGPNLGLFDTFRDQDWVDAWAGQSFNDVTDDALKQGFDGPFSKEWTKDPARPIICIIPRENAAAPRSSKRFTADDVRHSIYWSLFTTAPAGIGYSAEGVADWNTSIEPKDQKARETEFPLWQKSLFLPGAKQLTALANFLSSMEFWRLRPEPSFVANQPGNQVPHRFIAASGTESKDLTLVYSPEDRTLEIMLEALPPSPTVGWFNPRTGENSPAVAVVGARTCQFPTPDPGDWVLVMKAGK